MVGPSTPRARPGSAGPSAKARACTPFGMITASPPRCSTCTRRAKSDTAIRPAIFSSQGRTSGPNAARVLDRVVAAWKVATIGPSAIMHTDRPKLHAGHRAVVRKGHGAPGPRRVLVGQRLLALGRGEHLDVVAHPAPRLGEVAHVVLHPAGDVPLVGADQPDAHQSPSTPVRLGEQAGARPAGGSGGEPAPNPA